MVYLSRVIDGATAGNISLAQAYISDNTEAKDRTKSFALIGIAFGLGFFVGPGLDGVPRSLRTFRAHLRGSGDVARQHRLYDLPLAAGHNRPFPTTTDVGPGGQHMPIFEWKAYAPYFTRPVLSGLLAQFFFYALCFSTFTSGFALFAEREVHLGRAPGDAARDRLPARVRRVSRHRPTGVPHRPARQAVRRVGAHIGGVHFTHRRLRRSSAFPGTSPRSCSCRPFLRSATVSCVPRSAASFHRTQVPASKGSSSA